MEELKKDWDRQYINIHCSIIHNDQKVRTTQASLTDEWLNKMWSIHTVEYYSVRKKNEVLTHAATWMNPEDSRPKEINQSQKDKYPTIPLTCSP